MKKVKTSLFMKKQKYNVIVHITIILFMKTIFTLLKPSIDLVTQLPVISFQTV